MDISDIIRSRRAALGLSQAELAKKAGISLRQLARYEAGDQQPVLSAAVALADALGISMDQLAGKVSYGLDLSGDWWGAWQTWKDGAPHIDTHPWRCTSEARCSSSTPSGPSRSQKAATAGGASCACGTTKP
jgi:DNA-binding XRE family transcriptional regulator